ncbi:hypothetical protein ACCT20_38110, partial [Rhizobium ruizarguesonis]
ASVWNFPDWPFLRVFLSYSDEVTRSGAVIVELDAEQSSMDREPHHFREHRREGIGDRLGVRVKGGFYHPIVGK